MKLNSYVHKIKRRFFLYINRRNYIFNLHLKLLQQNAKPIEKGFACIIFSMDRAIQLHALLNSFLSNKTGECDIIVLYRSTSQVHEMAYAEVFDLFKAEVKAIKHDSKLDFKPKLTSIIDTITSGKIFFLVDDILFTEAINLNDLEGLNTREEIFSLRLGDHLTYSYVVNKAQSLPVLNYEDEYIKWKWNEGELDWSYPLSVDGHIFNVNEMSILCHNLDYNSPTTFEESLQNVRDVFAVRTGVAFKKAVIVNNPCNKVQVEVNNLHGSVHQDTLLQYWIEGKRIHIEEYYGYKNSSVHEELMFSFIDRDE